MSESASKVPDLIRHELPRLYAFAFCMCGNREDAKAHIKNMVRVAKAKPEDEIMGGVKPADSLLGLLARQMEEALGRKTEYSFEGLDETLRSDITRPIDLASGVGGLGNDPTKVHLMLWELKRTCLTATLCCLPPGVRVSFVLTDLMGYSPGDASSLLEIKDSAYRVRLTRARKRIEDYLAPRCFHVDHQNPCTCTGRLIIAIDANFVKMPAYTADIPHDAHDGEGPRRDMASLYGNLPRVGLPDEDYDSLASA